MGALYYRPYILWRSKLDLQKSQTAALTATLSSLMSAINIWEAIKQSILVDMCAALAADCVGESYRRWSFKYCVLVFQNSEFKTGSLVKYTVGTLLGRDGSTIVLTLLGINYRFLGWVITLPNKSWQGSDLLPFLAMSRFWAPMVQQSKVQIQKRLWCKGAPSSGGSYWLIAELWRGFGLVLERFTWLNWF